MVYIVLSMHHFTLNNRKKMKAHFLIAIRRTVSKQGHGNELHYSRYDIYVPPQNTFMKAKAQCMMNFISSTFVRMKFNARIVSEASLL